MCFGGSPKTPTVTPTPPAPAAATESASEVVAARSKEKRRVAAAEGKASTMLTGSLGDTSSAPVAQKTLLGA